MEEILLYSDQEEVVQRPLQGENIIIWLPTGAGKTRAAAYVALRHLQTRPGAKVMVLVNMVHLVDQHYRNEFKRFLSPDYKVLPLSGESAEKDFFGKVLKKSDVLICTAQLLYNAMMSNEEDRHVELSDVTLLIVDECHHTHKDSTYSKIMRCYVTKKLKGEGPLPQVLGLTASPGTGGQKVLEAAVKHVLTICANLDSAIVSAQTHLPEQMERVPRPRKQFNITEKRLVDPLGDHVKWMMRQIHQFMNLPPDVRLREPGTQEYEQDVVLLEQRGVKEDNRVMAQCALHLRQYNDALLIHDTLRKIDAYNHLKDFYSRRNTMDDTDLYLVGLFEENDVELRQLVKSPMGDNPKMDQLKEILLEQFDPQKDSRGILFVKTRLSVSRLHEWIQEHAELQAAGIKAAKLTGAGNSLTHMTPKEQEGCIERFRDGRLNLLISTTVAEEGLDITECNVIVRYGLLTNEIAQLQASGRARAQDSVYSVVAERGGREQRRELINEQLEALTKKAVAQVQAMSDEEFRKEIGELQREEMTRVTLAEQTNNKKRHRFSAAAVQLVCRNCLKSVAFGSDVQRVEGSHYVNVNPEFRREFNVGGLNNLQQTFKDWEPGRKILCNNGNCNKEWGFEMRYKGSALLAILNIKSFALLTPEGRMTVKKWKDVPFPVEEFDYLAFSQEHFLDSFDE